MKCYAKLNLDEVRTAYFFDYDSKTSSFVVVCSEDLPVEEVHFLKLIPTFAPQSVNTSDDLQEMLSQAVWSNLEMASMWAKRWGHK